MNRTKNDTISRTAMVDAVESVDWYHQNKSGEMVSGANDNEHQAWYKADDIYKAIESVPSTHRWIPCSEKLPDEEGVYLVTDKSLFGEKINLRYLNIHEKDVFWSGYESDVVLAWMPMPTPYREGEEHET